MKYKYIFQLFLIISFACTNSTKEKQGTNEQPISFAVFQDNFLDSFFKNNPAYAIDAGYGKYYDQIKIPDSAAFAGDLAFNRRWFTALGQFNYSKLSNDDKINYKIIENQLQANTWYIDSFKIQEWDPSRYNIGSDLYGILNQNDVSLDSKLTTLSAYLQNSEAYYLGAVKTIKIPTKEHTELAIHQNLGSLNLFGSSLDDSIRLSSFSKPKKDTLLNRIAVAKKAINNYISFLKNKLTGNKENFRDSRIGKQLFHSKFKYDLVTDISPEQLYADALAAKKSYHSEMFHLANQLWTKYFGDSNKPGDSLQLIKMMIDKVALQHVAPKDLLDTARSQVERLESFIIQKDLFQYDTSYPLKVRVTPGYASGVSVASAVFPSPYQKSSTTYYNIDDLTKIPPAKAESQLREYNNYTLQILTMHEAMPGHCLQGVYNSKNRSGMVKSVFQNNAMIEGWAVYIQKMMLENGWGNNEPELWLMFYKWSLRECCNVIVDYGLHCLNFSKPDIEHLLIDEAFQESAQVEEKYKRARLSQVQLCTYFNGATEIRKLKEDYQKKKGNEFRLKDFHERFLSYGSAPVKYLRDLLLQ